MKTIFTSLAAAVALTGTVLAQQTAPVSNPTTNLPNFDVQSIGPVLNELGVTWQVGTDGSGNSFVMANAGGEAVFFMQPAACRIGGNSDCVGLSMVALFEGDANPQTVSAFNYRYAFASAGLDPSGTAYLKRYEISDYGTPRGNLATSILVFVEQTKMLQNELSTARQTIALEGQADDLAASALNRNSVSDLTGVAAHAVNPIDQHQMGLETTADHILNLIADKSAPRNKIENLRKD